MPSTTLGVLITYFNEGELLTACLASLARQTAPVDEVLIYDDASEIPAEQFVPSGFPARIIRGGANRGPAGGRNVLARESRCDYIHFHDSDDLFEPHWSAEVRQSLAAGDMDAVFSEVGFGADDHTRTLRGVIGLATLATGATGEDFVRFCIRGSLLTPSGTYTRAAFEAVGGYREDVWQSEDWDFHVRLAASGIRYQVISKTLVRCRKRTGSRSRKRVEVLCSALQAIERLARELPSTYRRDLSEKAAELGSKLYRLGALDDARVAFEVATTLGPPTFDREGRAYRALFRCFGPEVAERAGLIYRRLVPETVRRVITH